MMTKFLKLIPDLLFTFVLSFSFGIIVAILFNVETILIISGYKNSGINKQKFIERLEKLDKERDFRGNF